jgi:thioesterase domain-containing protein
MVEYKKNPGRQNSLLHPCQTQGSKPPIFSYGGSTRLASHLGTDQPIYWFDFHGMNGLPMPATIEEMAAEYIAEIRLIQPRGPYFLLGYSMGGLVMFEAAHQLLRLKEGVALLVLIDPSPPSNLQQMTHEAVPGRSPSPSQKGFLSSVISRMSGDFLQRVRRRSRWAGRRLKRTACEVVLALGYRLPPFLRLFYFDDKSVEVIGRYNAQPYPGSFLLFRRPDNRSEAQWRGIADGEVEIHETWVAHEDLLEEPYVEILAGKIKEQLQQIRLDHYDAAGQLHCRSAGL